MPHTQGTPANGMAWLTTHTAAVTWMKVLQYRRSTKQSGVKRRVKMCTREKKPHLTMMCCCASSHVNFDNTLLHCGPVLRTQWCVLLRNVIRGGIGFSSCQFAGVPLPPLLGCACCCVVQQTTSHQMSQGTGYLSAKPLPAVARVSSCFSSCTRWGSAGGSSCCCCCEDVWGGVACVRYTHK